MKQIINQIDDIIASVPGLAGRVDTSKIALAGHSLGGQTAGVLLGARANDPNDPDASAVDMSDPRTIAGLLLSAPGNGGSDLTEGASSIAGFSFMNPTSRT